MQVGSTVIDARMISEIVAGGVISVRVYVLERVEWFRLSKRLYKELEDISCETVK